MTLPLARLAAWCCPLLTIKRWNNPVHSCDITFDRIGWSVRFFNHHYSRSPSLRTALLAALAKVEPSQSAPTKENTP